MRSFVRFGIMLMMSGCVIGCFVLTLIWGNILMMQAQDLGTVFAFLVLTVLGVVMFSFHRLVLLMYRELLDALMALHQLVESSSSTYPCGHQSLPPLPAWSSEP